MTNFIQNSGCVIVREGKLLVLFKIKHSHYELPGGKMEPGETIQQTAIRETKEEIGVDVELHQYLGYLEFHINEKDYRSHNFLAAIKKGQEPTVMEKDVFKEILWMPLKEYKKYPVANNVREFCENYERTGTYVLPTAQSSNPMN